MRSTGTGRTRVSAATWVLLAAVGVSYAAGPTWTMQAPGIETAQYNYNLGTPKNPVNAKIFAARMSRSEPNAIIESGVASDPAAGGSNISIGATQTVVDQATNYDDAINGWGDGSTNSTIPYYGKRNNVVVAINGSGFDIGATGLMENGMISSGSFIKPYTYNGYGGFFYGYDRTPVIAAWFKPVQADQIMSIWQRDEVSGEDMRLSILPINAVNAQCIPYTGNPCNYANSELTVFTPDYGLDTDNLPESRYFLLVSLKWGTTWPFSDIAPVADNSEYLRGVIVHQGWYTGGVGIPFGHVVIAAKGDTANALANMGILTNGDFSVRFNMNMPGPSNWATFEPGDPRHGIPPNHKDPLQNWSAGPIVNNVYAGVGGNRLLVKDGAPYNYDDVSADKDTRRARTVVAYNSSYIYFVVVEKGLLGVGMTEKELANFCVASANSGGLGATFAINQDGGPSSQMVVNGQLVNSTEPTFPLGTRPVANSLMMVQLQSRRCESTDYPSRLTFRPLDGVTCIRQTVSRQGPGDNYPASYTIMPDASGTIADSDLCGVYAKGSYWYPVMFPSFVNPLWVNGADFELVTFGGPGSQILADPSWTSYGYHPWVYHNDAGYGGSYWTDTSISGQDPNTGDDAIWEFTLTQTGIYDIFLWWPFSGAEYCSDNDLVFYHQWSGPQQGNMWNFNQAATSQKWVYIGSYNVSDITGTWWVWLEADGNDPGKIVQADAAMIRLRSSGSSPSQMVANASSDLTTAAAQGSSKPIMGKRVSAAPAGFHTPRMLKVRPGENEVISLQGAP